MTNLVLEPSDHVLPCPFCGGSDLELLNPHLVIYLVKCNGCGAEAHGGVVDAAVPFDKLTRKAHQEAKGKALAAWNRRPSSEPSKGGPPRPSEEAWAFINEGHWRLNLGWVALSVYQFLNPGTYGDGWFIHIELGDRTLDPTCPSPDAAWSDTNKPIEFDTAEEAKQWAESYAGRMLVGMLATIGRPVHEPEASSCPPLLDKGAFFVCAGCDQTRPQAHTWEECTAGLRKDRNAFLDRAIEAERRPCKGKSAQLATLYERRFTVNSVASTHVSVTPVDTDRHDSLSRNAISLALMTADDCSAARTLGGLIGLEGAVALRLVVVDSEPASPEHA